MLVGPLVASASRRRGRRPGQNIAFQVTPLALVKQRQRLEWASVGLSRTGSVATGPMLTRLIGREHNMPAGTES